MVGVMAGWVHTLERREKGECVIFEVGMSLYRAAWGRGV